MVLLLCGCHLHLRARVTISAEFDDQPGALDVYIDRLVKAKKVAEVEVLNITNKELTMASPKLACT